MSINKIYAGLWSLVWVMVFAAVAMHGQKASASEASPPPFPASVNGSYHLIVIFGSEDHRAIDVNQIYELADGKVIFLGEINGQKVSGELIRGVL